MRTRCAGIQQFAGETDLADGSFDQLRGALGGFRVGSQNPREIVECHDVGRMLVEDQLIDAFGFGIFMLERMERSLVELQTDRLGKLLVGLYQPCGHLIELSRRCVAMIENRQPCRNFEHDRELGPHARR